MNNKIKRLIMTVVGMVFVGVAIGFLLHANLGTDPFTAAVSGAAKIFNFKYGIMYCIVVAILFVVIFFLDKHYIGIGTVINIFIVGNVGDFTHRFLQKLYDADTWQIRILTFLFAIILLCLASSLYIVSDSGVSSYDALSLIMSDKKGASYRICRVITDVVSVIIAFILGARQQVGIGTVITAFGLGPITQFFIHAVANRILYGKEKSKKEL